MMNKFQKKLAQLERQGRYRTLNLPNGIDLTSNDYLGMRGHPKLRQVALEAIEGGIELGAGGSRLLRGHMDEHARLEDYAAEYFDVEAALFFATGYQANMALFQALPSRHDTIIFDELIHASAREGIQNSPARRIKALHNDLSSFERCLKEAKASEREQIWVAVESVYSMDGDLGPLPELQKLAEKYDAILIVDEAHGTGIFGENGRGLSEGLPHENMITLHTCGKALGVAGGLICGPKILLDYMINTARPFIYSTAPPPLQARLVQAALKILDQDPQRRARLFELIDLSKTILPVSKIKSPIVPIVLGDDQRAVEVANALQNQGYDVRAIRPPTVPENSSRLRITLSINLEEDVLRNFADALNICLAEK